MTEELNGGCLDEREAFDRYWLARQRWLGFGKNLTDAEMLAYPDRREGEFHAWKAGRASLSTSKQAGEEPVVRSVTAEEDGVLRSAILSSSEIVARGRLATPPAVMPAAPSDAVLRTALANLLRYAERETCRHEETHRGGALWTICEGCGMKWADDRGGFQPYVEPAEFIAASAALSQTMQPQAERSFAVALGEESIRSFAKPAAGEQAGAVADGLPFGIIDPDYARYYTLIRTTAWQCGYAIGLHGSFTRDLDLIAVPWTAQALPLDLLIKQIEYRTDLKRQEPEGREKPHGRMCWSLLLPGFSDPRWIDLSVMPTLAAPGAAIAAREQEAES